MPKFIYSREYGWTPLRFLFKGKNFYKEKKKWVIESIKKNHNSKEDDKLSMISD